MPPGNSFFFLFSCHNYGQHGRAKFASSPGSFVALICIQESRSVPKWMLHIFYILQSNRGSFADAAWSMRTAKQSSVMLTRRRRREYETDYNTWQKGKQNASLSSTNPHHSISTNLEMCTLQCTSMPCINVEELSQSPC